MNIIKASLERPIAIVSVIIMTIILGIVLIILLYILYKYLTTDKALLQEYVHLMQDDLKPITDLGKPKTPNRKA